MFSAHYQLARQNLLRTKTTTLISILGVGIAMGLYLFSAALTQGIRNLVFDKVFVTDSIQVVPKRVVVGIFETNEGPSLNQELIDKLRKLGGVEQAFPRMHFTFPASFTGSISELVNRVMRSKMMKASRQRISFEIVADGVSSSMIAETLKKPSQFKEQESSTGCSQTSECITGLTCQNGICAGAPCDPSNERVTCPETTYCASYFTPKKTKAHRCEPPIPAVISEHLLEMYNGGIATAMNLPLISKRVTDELQPVIPLTLGSSFMARRSSDKRLTKYVQLVGISRHAVAIGLTLPLSYVKQLNRDLKGDAAAEKFHSVTLKLSSPESVDRIKNEIEALGLTLGDDTAKAEQAAQVLRTVEIILTALALLILLVVAINLAQTFTLLIRHRRREIGLFRSLGATKDDVRSVILWEAGLIGLLGAIVGASGGIGASLISDLCLDFIPYFPYKPETLFSFNITQFLLVFAVSQLFCLLGAYFPARRAANLSPADALSTI